MRFELKDGAGKGIGKLPMCRSTFAARGIDNFKLEKFRLLSRRLDTHMNSERTARVFVYLPSERLHNAVMKQTFLMVI